MKEEENVQDAICDTIKYHTTWELSFIHHWDLKTLQDQLRLVEVQHTPFLTMHFSRLNRDVRPLLRLIFISLRLSIVMLELTKVCGLVILPYRTKMTPLSP